MKGTRLTALTLALLLLAGCARTAPSSDSSQPAAGSSEPERPGGPKVQVDWSRLEENQTALRPDTDGGRWYEEYTGELIPSEDYGDLVPYVGSMAYSVETWLDDSGQEQRWYSPWPTSLYGLMTREGKLVTDPVYLSANQADFTWQGQSTTLPVLLLSMAKEEWGDFCNGRRYAVAAPDGSWITDFDFWNYTTREDEVLLYGPGGVTWIDAVSGAREDWSWEFLGVAEEELPSVVEQIMWLYGFQWTEAGIFLGTDTQTRNILDADQVRVFHPETTEVAWMPRSEWETSLGQWNSQQWPPTGYWEDRREGDRVTLSKDGQSYTLTAPQLGESFSFEVSEPFVALCDFSGEQSRCWLYRLSDGELLLEGRSISFWRDNGAKSPYVLVQNDRSGFTVYSPELQPLLTVPGGSWAYCSLSDGLLSIWDDSTFFSVWDLDREEYIFYRNLTLGD